MVAVKIGSTVSQAVATSVLAAQVGRAAVATEFSRAASAMTFAQAQVASKSLALVRVRIQDGPRVEQLANVVKDFASRNPTALADVERMTASGAASLALKSNLIAGFVGGALQESIAVAQFVSSGDQAAFHRATVTTASQTAASLALGAGGAALGAVLFPGPGAVLGSLIGSFAGGYLAPVPAQSKPADEDQTGYGEEVAATLDEGDYVVVCIVDTPTCRFPVPETNSTASLIRTAQEGVQNQVDHFDVADDDVLLVYAFVDEADDAQINDM